MPNTGIITTTTITTGLKNLSPPVARREIRMPFRTVFFLTLVWGMPVTLFADDPAKSVTLSETPVAVQKAIKVQAGDGKLGSIDRVVDGDETNYDVELTAQDGQARDFAVAGDGTLLSVEVTLRETPAAVQKTITAQLNGGTLDSIDKNLDDELSFDVALITKDGRNKRFNVTAKGDVASSEVTLAETPPAVQKTIKQEIGEGKIIRIDRSFVELHGVLPYEVQGWKDGKSFDFSVGPKGRFLGMDDD
jgi:hypothetical protein